VLTENLIRKVKIMIRRSFEKLKTLRLYFLRQRNVCKNCWFYHKRIKECKLCRSTEMGNVGMSVSKYDTCEHFIK
jgi:hypothetical protein